MSVTMKSFALSRLSCSAVTGFPWTRTAVAQVSWKCWSLRVRVALSLPDLPLPQIKMNVPSSPLCAPLNAPSAPTPTAAISAVPGGDATRVLSPMMTGPPVWVSGSDRNSSTKSRRSSASLTKTPPAFLHDGPLCVSSLITFSPFLPFLCSPGGLLWGNAVFRRTQPFSHADPLHSATHLCPSANRRAVAATVFSSSLLNVDVQKLSNSNFSQKNSSSFSCKDLCCLFSIRYLQRCPLVAAAVLSPCSSHSSLDFKEPYGEHDREQHVSELTVSLWSPSSPDTYPSGTWS